MKKVIIRLALILLAVVCSARSSSAYWQQHVEYHIAVTLLDSIHTLDGSLSVQYTNNSPDTLKSIYFHLYYEAFQPGSMMDVRSQEIGGFPINDRISKLPPSEWGKYWMGEILVGGKKATYKITGTIMRVDLPEPMLPNSTIEIGMRYREQIPRQIRRGGWMNAEGVEYSMSQWYPKICEYDTEGWQIQEYIMREFYGVWGNFDVEITLPSRFTVGSSGQCMNPAEVGHGYDRIAVGQPDGISYPNPDTSGITH